MTKLCDLPALDLTKDHLYFFKEDTTLEQKIEALLKINWYGSECDVCGHSLIPWKAQFIGVYEDNQHEIIKLCSICFQVDFIANKEYLHDKPANWVNPILFVFMVGLEKKRTAVWKVLSQEPWIKQIKRLEIC